MDNFFKSICNKFVDEASRTSKDKGIAYLHCNATNVMSLSGVMPITSLVNLNVKAIIGNVLLYLTGKNTRHDAAEYGIPFNVYDSKCWSNSIYKKSSDDLGRLPGVQLRKWETAFSLAKVDQLKELVDLLTWKEYSGVYTIHNVNPGEVERTAYVGATTCLLFSVNTRTRSLDMVAVDTSLNITAELPVKAAEHCITLSIVAKLCGLAPGKVTQNIHSVHMVDTPSNWAFVKDIADSDVSARKPAVKFKVPDNLTLTFLKKAIVKDFTIVGYSPVGLDIKDYIDEEVKDS